MAIIMRYKWLFWGLLSVNLIGILLFVWMDHRYKVYERVLQRYYRQESMPGINRHTEYLDMYDSINASTDAIVMLGNSIIHEAHWHELLPGRKVVNRGIPGDRVEGLLSRSASVIRNRPSCVVIMGGINDLFQGSDVEEIIHVYRQLLAEFLHNNIKVVVCSTLYTRYQPEINESVHRLNMALEVACIEDNILFLDLNETMTEDRRLLARYTYDGVHLTAAAYRKWLEILEPHLPRKVDE